MRFFEGRDLMIATKHRKEEVIAPILVENLGVHLKLNSLFDTDVLGTFSGEIERTGNVLETLREKCYLTHKQHAVDLVVASEGSFGLHPFYSFIPADEEWLLLKDFANNLEIKAKILSTETNFSAAEVESIEELQSFARQAKFPSHALILKSSLKDFKYCFKGLNQEEKLFECFRFLQSNREKIVVETDMRALYNPTRMGVIKEVTQQLLQKIQTSCPQCNIPGFDIQKVIKGLPCEWCHNPTQSTLKLIYQCEHCDMYKEEIFPNGKEFEDPTYCNYCNP